MIPGQEGARAKTKAENKNVKNALKSVSIFYIPILKEHPCVWEMGRDGLYFDHNMFLGRGGQGLLNPTSQQGYQMWGGWGGPPPPIGDLFPPSGNPESPCIKLLVPPHLKFFAALRAHLLRYV